MTGEKAEINQESITAEMARARLEKDRQERINRAQRKISAILKEERCDIVTEMRITEDGRIESRAIIVAL